MRDALRLSSAMTRKLAGCGLDYGGGKAVLAVPHIPEGEERRELLLRYGEFVQSLGGTYHTAPDVNTGEADMDIIAERCQYVFGKSVANGGSGNTAPATARGVFYGIQAALEHLTGSSDLTGRKVLVQGVGDVGRRLAAHLVKAGARVMVSDVDGERVRETVQSLGAIAVPASRALETECDVLAPCALGGVLSSDTIPRLRCAVVAGAANNQLLRDEDAALLGARGILYAPDYIINAGGVLHGLCIEEMGWSEEQLQHRLLGIGKTLREVFQIAGAEGVSTEQAAEWLVERRLAEAPNHYA
ncbi:MAG: Glu/Leu/Phe/Val dehydrogenase family protein [Hyphomicrobiales bacterium]